MNTIPTKITTLLFCLFSLCLVAGGCEGEHAAEDKEGAMEEDHDKVNDVDDVITPFFPTQPNPQEAVMEALMIGELKLEGNCLRVENSLVIWPYGFSLVTEDGKMLVKDEAGNVVAEVGKEVKMGGGEVRELHGDLESMTEHGCDGPYWIAGDFPKE